MQTNINAPYPALAALLFFLGIISPYFFYLDSDAKTAKAYWAGIYTQKSHAGDNLLTVWHY